MLSDSADWTVKVCKDVCWSGALCTQLVLNTRPLEPCLFLFSLSTHWRRNKKELSLIHKGEATLASCDVMETVVSVGCDWLGDMRGPDKLRQFQHRRNFSVAACCHRKVFTANKIKETQSSLHWFKLHFIDFSDFISTRNSKCPPSLLLHLL